MPVRPFGGLLAAVMDLDAVERIVSERLRPVVQAVADAEAVGEDARQMVIRRDEKLNQAASDSAAAISETSTLAQVAASYAAALPASVADRAALHAADAGFAAQDAELLSADARFRADIATLFAAVATIPVPRPATLGAVAVPATLLGATQTVTVPLARTMPGTDYTAHPVHTATVDLSRVRLEVTARTTTTVTVKITPVGILTAAGIVIVHVP